MAASYEFATGSVRVREGALLSAADLAQLMAAPDEATMAAMLRDKGFGDPAAPTDTVEELLRWQTMQTWQYLFSLLPDPSLLQVFLIRHDLHNAKCLLKGTLSNRKVDGLLMQPTITPPGVIAEAIKAKNFTDLPAWMAAALESAYDTLAQSGDVQRADALLDRAAMDKMLHMAAETNVAMLQKIVKATVFYADVTLALRAARVHMPESYLDVALCPCEGVDLYEWKRALRSGEDALIELLEQTDAFDCAAAMEAYRRAPVFFEKWVDDYRLSLAREGKMVTAGPEPLLGYLMAREAEDKAVRMAATGIRTGQSIETMQERMRELYG